MDERELTMRIKALNKAIVANEPAASILALMNTLKEAGAPTEDILRVSFAIDSLVDPFRSPWCLFSSLLSSLSSSLSSSHLAIPQFASLDPLY